MQRIFGRLAVFALAVTVLGGGCLPGRARAALRVGSDVSFAPLEFYTGSAKTMTGFDIDLTHALASKLGVPVVLENHNFDDLIPSIKAGKFDLVISAMSDSSVREKHVDFVDYLLAGSGMLVPAGNPKRVFELAGLCGLTVDVEKGTSQESVLQAQAKACKSIGLGPIKVLAFGTDADAYKNFAAGKSDVHVTDYPVVAYLARLSNGKYAVAGRQFNVVPYGIAVGKNNVALRGKVQAALADLIADGTYDKLVQKWGLGQGALRSAPTNAGKLFEK